MIKFLIPAMPAFDGDNFSDSEKRIGLILKFEIKNLKFFILSSPARSPILPESRGQTWKSAP